MIFHCPILLDTAGEVRSGLEKMIRELEDTPMPDAPIGTEDAREFLHFTEGPPGWADFKQWAVVHCRFVLLWEGRDRDGAYVRAYRSAPNLGDPEHQKNSVVVREPNPEAFPSTALRAALKAASEAAHV